MWMVRAMLPRNVINMLNDLYHQTESGVLKWNYDSDNDVVEVVTPKATISIFYSFNYLEEVGEYKIYYTEKSSGISANFVTNQLYRDYEKVRVLFDSAKASGMSFGF